MLTRFVYTLIEYGIPISMQYVIDFYNGIEKGIAEDIDDLFIFSRLCFVKKVEYMDAFQRAFAYYFFNIKLPDVAEGDLNLLETKEFKLWLQNAIKKGDIPKNYWSLGSKELMKKFWDTVREQTEAHNGGNKWVGTGGSSPFGHSGLAQKGVRVHGDSNNKSAFKVIGDRRYIEYSERETIKGENIRQALSALKHIKQSGAYTELDIDETIRNTSRNGGEIELIFSREKIDKLEIILLIDNGGSSMSPYVDLTRLLFSKLNTHFKRIETFYFHNTIYDEVYKDQRRYEAFSTNKLLESSSETRIIILGDASMAPEELIATYGSISWSGNEEPSISWLNKIKNRFKHIVWLNPIPKEQWQNSYGSWTINRINNIFHMEDFTLSGLKKSVEYLNSKN